MTGVRRFFLAVGCLSFLGLVTGLSLRRWGAPLVSASRPALTLEPSVLELPHDPQEGEVLSIYFQLTNRGDRAVTVAGLGTSCACMALAGKQPLQPPFELAPDTSTPIELKIHTHGRLGPQQFKLWIEPGLGGRQLETVISTIKVNVLAGLTAEPSRLVFPGAEAGIVVQRSLELADMLPDPGVEIEKVVSSRPERLKGELVPDVGPTAIFRGLAGKKRYRLDISYTPADAPEGIEECLTLIPVDSKYRPLRIPIFSKTAKPSYEFSPPGLTLVARQPGERFRRIVFFSTNKKDEAPLVEVVDPPKEIKVTVADGPGQTKQVSIECTAPETTEAKKTDLRFAVGPEKTPVSFPITFVTLEQAAATPRP